MANALVPGWKPGSQTNYEYRPNHQQHLEVLSHLNLKVAFSVFSENLQLVVVTARFLKLL